jgi:hypothetical protein
VVIEEDPRTDGDDVDGHAIPPEPQ